MDKRAKDWQPPPKPRMTNWDRGTNHEGPQDEPYDPDGSGEVHFLNDSDIFALEFFGLTHMEAKERYRELCGCDPEGDAMMFDPQSRAFCVAYGTEISFVAP